MAKRMKAYLPKWILWIIVPMLLVMWGFVTYSAFGTASGREELGVIGWLLMTLVFALVGTILGLMASGKLPAYIVELEDDDEPPKR
ncbi:MAG: hypothetical protein WEA80_12760 [Gemmatimonadaceae bacterium]